MDDGRMAEAITHSSSQCDLMGRILGLALSRESV